ncbi:hypothetical protein LBLM1_05580 [Limosilactobacillus mucosae LM1]|uniref:Uncharacterized protein n=1 Tax=Limosilactobacillus mucosae LM1 TaxID=1130798 RepID=A0A0D4CKX2_LIMMU|nr:hypothetical protein LBLM1_05580 [Limosilactobacillus mucosae LM1]
MVGTIEHGVFQLTNSAIDNVCDRYSTTTIMVNNQLLNYGRRINDLAVCRIVLLLSNKSLPAKIQELCGFKTIMMVRKFQQGLKKSLILVYKLGIDQTITVMAFSAIKIQKYLLCSETK